MERRVLDNGVVILADYRPGMSSVALNLTFAIGNRHEPHELGGITHFVEHVVFKGTRKRDLNQIAKEINEQGGFFNASTGNDSMRLETRVIAEDVPAALDLMLDLALNSTFPKREVERERGVILEEISEYRDSPEDLCFDEWLRTLWAPNPLGSSILGEPETIERLKASELKEWLERLQHPEQMIVSIAGNFQSEHLAELTKRMSRLKPKGARIPDALKAEGQGNSLRIQCPLEQVQFCLGHEGPSRNHPGRIAAQLGDIILGGGMGSRLFNEIREKRGLAYTIASTYYGMRKEGYFLIYGSTLPEKHQEVVSICREECAKFAEEGPTEEELRTAKLQFTRLILLSQDNPSTFASRNSDREVYQSEHLSDTQLLDSIRTVTQEEVVKVCRTIFRSPFASTLVGPLD